MDAASIEAHYPTVMHSLIGRLSAASSLLTQIDENKEHRENWLRLDSVALQVRKVCELIVLGSTLAHLQEGTELDPKHWHPKDAFKELEKFNQHPLPMPLQLYISVDEHGAKQFVPAMKPIPLLALNRVYGQCANILHVPSAQKVLEEQVVPFEWAKYRSWVDDLVRVTRSHALLLPSIQSLIVCRWSGVCGEDPEITMASGIGEAVLDAENLADFDLLSA
ncbi:hypothetical protein [Allopontixanthobacter sp.]|uniref:hypothetical protein n=1 Tax=Allopontixanthobacter sp. TaxID=2906452 RepID=UPI002AB8C52A|nr:hypothetical protein [Allopontixanthobacter sp.]MDZ4307682.1 hypothetical protein [Allopontixanthobacter sp.]